MTYGAEWGQESNTIRYIHHHLYPQIFTGYVLRLPLNLLYHSSNRHSKTYTSLQKRYAHLIQRKYGKSNTEMSTFQKKKSVLVWKCKGNSSKGCALQFRISWLTGSVCQLPFYDIWKGEAARQDLAQAKQDISDNICHHPSWTFRNILELLKICQNPAEHIFIIISN